MKKPRPNTPKTIDGTPARLLTAMRTTLHERALLRVLAQVERGEHAEGRHHDAT